MKTLLKRVAIVLFALVLCVAAITAIQYFGGQPMGIFAGSRPDSLGFSAGKFTPPSWKPNSVSSTVEKSDEKHFIAPIAFASVLGRFYTLFGRANSLDKVI